MKLPIGFNASATSSSMIFHGWIIGKTQPSGTLWLWTQEDGRRIRSSSYFANGRFYEIVATVLPERGDLAQVFPSRFDQTIRFNIAAP
jgi:hypothetical protein